MNLTAETGALRPLDVVAIAGSLRRGSNNRKLLAAAVRLAPGDLRLQVYDDLASVPLFNEDLEVGPHQGPEPVHRLRQAVARADGLLIATPEYNQSIPGGVKNMVDWLSRSTPGVLEDKPVAIVGATVGPWGTRLSQAALRHTLTACGALVMSAPQLYVRNASEVFDAGGEIADARTATALAELLAGFGRWMRTVQPLGALEEAR